MTELVTERPGQVGAAMAWRQPSETAGRVLAGRLYLVQAEESAPG